MRIDARDHARISAAIAAAEASTSGEIFCVLTRRVSSYRDVSLGWAIAAALVLPLAMIPLGFDPAWIPGVAESWEAAHVAGRDLAVGQALAALVLLQSATFLIVLLIASLPGVRRLLTPAALRRRRTRRAALEQFLAHGLHQTEARTGVLIFAALDERRVEVIADEGIHAKVSEDVWIDAAAALTKGMGDGDAAGGFEAAIGLCGQVLAEHFPPGAINPNELSDRLVVI